MKLRRARARRKGRIEIIPMIDVMFFLLATFMLASLSLENLHSLPVDLPRGQALAAPPKASVTLTVTRAGDLALDRTPVTLETIGPTLMRLAPGGATSLVVNADSAAPNGIVVEAMLKARAAGVEHFLFAIKPE
ncbi:MAG TPA: biopolymer transporter ExbD [Alphaproteobacteria bacterium]|nr:biopolymer transporter ExbD [Alphaproteobacteria bacterium]